LGLFFLFYIDNIQCIFENIIFISRVRQKEYLIFLRTSEILVVLDSASLATCLDVVLWLLALNELQNVVLFLTNFSLKIEVDFPFFNSPQPKAQVSYCHRNLSGVRPSVNFILLTTSSQEPLVQFPPNLVGNMIGVGDPDLFK